MQIQCPIEIGGKTPASQAIRLNLLILSEINSQLHHGMNHLKSVKLQEGYSIALFRLWKLINISSRLDFSVFSRLYLHCAGGEGMPEALSYFN